MSGRLERRAVLHDDIDAANHAIPSIFARASSALCLEIGIVLQCNGSAVKALQTAHGILRRFVSVGVQAAELGIALHGQGMRELACLPQDQRCIFGIGGIGDVRLPVQHAHTVPLARVVRRFIDVDRSVFYEKRAGQMAAIVVILLRRTQVGRVQRTLTGD